MATKKRRKTPPGAPKHHRLTEEKRIIIETLRKEGCTKKHIAERAGRHPTTVCRSRGATSARAQILRRHAQLVHPPPAAFVAGGVQDIKKDPDLP